MVVQNRLKDIKKYWITFLAALFVAGVVVALFSLVLGGRSKNWISRNSGVGRESIFPYVFTDGNDIYVATDENNVKPVDTDAQNAVYDADIQKIYYTQYGLLYEYDLSKNYRKILCENVKKFRLFAERKSILIEDLNGALKLFSYNYKDELLLRSAENANLGEPVVGDSMVVFVDASDGKYTLKSVTTEGNVKVISETVKENAQISIYENDRAVLFETKTGAELYNFKTKKILLLEKANIIQPKEYLPGVELLGVKTFSDSLDIHYVLKEGTLSYIKFDGRNEELVVIAKNVSPENIVDYDATDDILVFENNGIIYVSNGGQEPTSILEDVKAENVCFDPNTNNVFADDDKNIYFVNVLDKNKTKNTVTDGTINGDVSVIPYHNKNICILSKQNGEFFYVIGGSRIEKGRTKALRLYGNSDTRYLEIRENSDGSSYALDFVDVDRFIRISSSTSANIAFDKKTDNILYVEGGALNYYKNGKVSVIGEFDEIKSVVTYADKK